jgi:hypothetical protein
MGKAYSTYGKEERPVDGFGGERYWKKVTSKTQA